MTLGRILSNEERSQIRQSWRAPSMWEMEPASVGNSSFSLPTTLCRSFYSLEVVTAPLYTVSVIVYTKKSNTTQDTIVGFPLVFKDDVHLWCNKSLNCFYGNEDRCGHWFVYSLSLYPLCKKVEHRLGVQPMALEVTMVSVEIDVWPSLFSFQRYP